MINKQNLWFATLFSIILMLSIFYISMNENDVSSLVENEVSIDDSSLVINESTELVSLRVANDEEIQNTMNELKDTLLSSTATLEEKNDAYDELQVISNTKSLEEKLEKIIKDDFKADSFVKINSSGITVVIDSDTNSYADANNVIRRIQKEFSEDKYITVKFN